MPAATKEDIESMSEVNLKIELKNIQKKMKILESNKLLSKDKKKDKKIQYQVKIDMITNRLNMLDELIKDAEEKNDYMRSQELKENFRYLDDQYVRELEFKDEEVKMILENVRQKKSNKDHILVVLKLDANYYPFYVPPNFSCLDIKKVVSNNFKVHINRVNVTNLFTYTWGGIIFDKDEKMNDNCKFKKYHEKLGNDDGFLLGIVFDHEIPVDINEHLDLKKEVKDLKKEIVGLKTLIIEIHTSLTKK